MLKEQVLSRGPKSEIEKVREAVWSLVRNTLADLYIPLTPAIYSEINFSADETDDTLEQYVVSMSIVGASQITFIVGVKRRWLLGDSYYIVGDIDVSPGYKYGTFKEALIAAYLEGE